MVANVPRIVAFWNSAEPDTADNLQPVTPLAKSEVSIVPFEPINKLLLVIEVSFILNPPIWPLSAVIVPDIETAEAVICPSDFSINKSFELDIAVGVIPNPPITPEPVALIVSAVMLPKILAADAVISPSPFTLNFDAEIKKSEFVVAEPLIKNVGAEPTAVVDGAKSECSFTPKLPMEAETNLAKPCAFISAK